MAPDVAVEQEVQEETQEAPETTEGTETPAVEEISSDSSQTASQQQPELDGRLKALEEQNRRFEERNRYLEQTARLLDQQSQQWRGQQQAPQPQRGNELAPEMQELDRTLSPIFDRRLQSANQPVIDTISRWVDEQDAARFEMYLMRNHPEIFEADGGLDRVFQDVEVVRRQAAQTYNQWLGRVDAFLYAEGIRGVQDKMKNRKEKKGVQAKAEAQRVQSVRTAQSGTIGAPPRKAPGAEIQAIREKANRGERLSGTERAKYRDFISGVTF
ncbi:MAG: hypothetical protein ACRD2L_14360 [Terriglobia bacterium]